MLYLFEVINDFIKFTYLKKNWQTKGKQKFGNLHASLICASKRIRAVSGYFK